MKKIEILYEDNHLLVVVKPSGILSQSDGSDTKDMLTELKSYLKEKYHKLGNVYLGLVHRLDKEVSGVMVFAKTSKAAARLSEQVRLHQFEKKYYAVCEGILIPKEGTFTDYMKRENFSSKIVSKEEGKLAILTYQVLKEKKNSLVDITLKTGRHHQIRVQFKARSHPLLGDKKYGKKGEYPIALMAYFLSFYHPITKEKLSFSIPLKKEGYFKEFVS